MKLGYGLWLPVHTKEGACHHRQKSVRSVQVADFAGLGDVLQSTGIVYRFDALCWKNDDEQGLTASLVQWKAQVHVHHESDCFVLPLETEVPRHMHSPHQPALEMADFLLQQNDLTHVSEPGPQYFQELQMGHGQQAGNLQKKIRRWSH